VNSFTPLACYFLISNDAHLPFVETFKDITPVINKMQVCLHKSLRNDEHDFWCILMNSTNF